MKPRIADDRVGYFMTPHKDFSRDRNESFFVYYINRWRMEKKDPGASMSEPKKPITFYVDTTIPEEYRSRMLQSVPLGRFAEPEEVAGVILFLCSELASYITGQTIHVNGGWWGS